MDFDQLEIFLRVATLKSFTRAGESLFLSQPTISARIKALENELGVTLFDRSRPRDLALTEQGLLFWDHAQQIMNVYNNSLEKIKQKEGDSGGYLRIGSSSVPGTYLLPSMLAAFKKSHPRAGINVSIKDSADVISGIINYSFDIGMSGYRESDPRLEYFEVAEDELILITAPGLLAGSGYRSGTAVPPDVCLELDFVLREPGSATRKLLEKTLNIKGYNINEFRSLLYMDSLESIKQSVRQGLGSSVVSRRSVEELLSSGAIDWYFIEELDLKRHFYMVYHRNRVLNNTAASFISFVRENTD